MCGALRVLKRGAGEKWCVDGAIYVQKRGASGNGCACGTVRTPLPGQVGMEVCRLSEHEDALVRA